MKSFFYSIRNGLFEIFSDGDGRLSSMRIGFFWILVFETLNQTWANVHGTYIPMNLEAMGTLAAAFFAKSWQKKIEMKSPKNCDDSSGTDETYIPNEHPRRHRRRL